MQEGHVLIVAAHVSCEIASKCFQELRVLVTGRLFLLVAQAADHSSREIFISAKPQNSYQVNFFVMPSSDRINLDELTSLAHHLFLLETLIPKVCVSLSPFLFLTL